MLDNLHTEVLSLKNSDKAAFLQRFFKTKKGEYGYGDIFYGLTVPQSRKIAMQFSSMSLSDVGKLLASKIHEERLIALLILTSKFSKASDLEKQAIYDFYLKNTRFVNNWDLVDTSAYKIVGAYLVGKNNRTILEKLAISNDMWERRIAIISTFQFITQEKSYTETFKNVGILLTDKNDLIQKAVGWMLREAGKQKSEKAETQIDERLLVAYHRLRGNANNGLAVVTIDRDSCSGCFNQIPPQRQLDIRQRKKIIVCELVYFNFCRSEYSSIGSKECRD